MNNLTLKLNGKTINPINIEFKITLPSGEIENERIINDMKRSGTFLVEISGHSYMHISGYQSGFFENEIGKRVKIDFVGQ